MKAAVLFGNTKLRRGCKNRSPGHAPQRSGLERPRPERGQLGVIMTILSNPNLIPDLNQSSFALQLFTRKKPRAEVVHGKLERVKRDDPTPEVTGGRPTHSISCLQELYRLLIKKQGLSSKPFKRASIAVNMLRVVGLWVVNFYVIRRIKFSNKLFFVFIPVDFFFFFFTPVQTPGTLCSGELWSILVVRLAHSADLRSRLRHVSSAPSVAYSTGCSWVVTHPGTNPARRCLTSVIWREPVCHRRLAVDR